MRSCDCGEYAFPRLDWPRVRPGAHCPSIDVLARIAHAQAPAIRNISLSQSRAHAPTSGVAAPAAAGDALDDPEAQAAASKIQAVARGAAVRQQQKDQRIWHAWNELDWKEVSSRRCRVEPSHF